MKAGRRVENPPTQTGIKPLTHLNGATGRPFQRDPEVEEQICTALALEPGALVVRAGVRDRSDPRFLREECLVYLIRELNQDAERRRVASDLSGELLLRIEGYLARELRRLGPDHYEEAGDEVVTKLFDKITDPHTDLGDFAQVSFWTFLAAKVSDAYRRHLTQLTKERSQVAPAWVHGGEAVGDQDGSRQGEDLEPEPTTGPELDTSLLAEELLDSLSGHHLAVMKLHMAGWPISSKNSGEPTISRYFGKTPRTINNWLREAHSQLLAAVAQREMA
ncbi:MAG: hypothetical protein ACJ78Q_07550 [Chloroflexia bacterium]